MLIVGVVSSLMNADEGIVEVSVKCRSGCAGRSEDINNENYGKEAQLNISDSVCKVEDMTRI